MSDIKEKVIQIIVNKLGLDQDQVTTKAHIINDLGADSIETVELIMEFEDKFEIEIPDDDGEKIATVGDAIAYLEEKLV